MPDRKSLRLSAVLLLVGLLLFVGTTALHPGGDANNHPVIFEVYAASHEWNGVHLGEFTGMAVLIAGLIVLVFAFNTSERTPGVAGWLGGISAVAALALYGVLQAVDGVALERAVDAWASAPAAEKAARYASAEAIRWLEEGTRSYQDILLGLAIVLLGVMVSRAEKVREANFNLRPIGYMMGLSGVAWVVQGWVLSNEGFSPTHTLTIIIAEILTLLWIIWLLVAAWRIQEPASVQAGYRSNP